MIYSNLSLNSAKLNSACLLDTHNFIFFSRISNILASIFIHISLWTSITEIHGIVILHQQDRNRPRKEHRFLWGINFPTVVCKSFIYLTIIRSSNVYLCRAEMVSSSSWDLTAYLLQYYGITGLRKLLIIRPFFLVGTEPRKIYYN